MAGNPGCWARVVSVAWGPASARLRNTEGSEEEGFLLSFKLLESSRAPHTSLLSLPRDSWVPSAFYSSQARKARPRRPPLPPQVPICVTMSGVGPRPSPRPLTSISGDLRRPPSTCPRPLGAHGPLGEGCVPSPG